MKPKTSRYYTYIRPIIRNKFAQTYSPLVFSLITIAIFSYYAIRPTVTTILSLQKSIDEQTSIYNRLQEKVKNLSEGKQNYANISQGVKEKLNNLTPDNPNLPQLIDTITYLSQLSEATVTGLQFQKIELENKKSELNKEATFPQVDFTLILQGTYSNHMNFLTALKRGDRLIKISSISFVQPTDSNLMMTINASAYYLKN